MNVFIYNKIASTSIIKSFSKPDEEKSICACC